MERILNFFFAGNFFTKITMLIWSLASSWFIEITNQKSQIDTLIDNTSNVEVILKKELNLKIMEIDGLNILGKTLQRYQQSYFF